MDSAVAGGSAIADNLPAWMEKSVTSIRKATIAEIRPPSCFLNDYAANGIMLPRTEFEMSENIRDFTVAYSENRLLGCGALHFYTPTSAEVRSLAVDPTLKSQGIGRLIVETLETEALENGLHALF